MLSKKIIFLAILLISLLSLSAVSAADDTASDISSTIDDVTLEKTVNEEIISEEGTGETTQEPKSFTNLNDTINGNSDDYISLDSDYNYTDDDSDFQHGINITRDVTINGNGHTIDGNNAARIFQVQECTVVFQNIDFVNGRSPGSYGDAGALWVYDGAKATAENCTFTNNHGTYRGGATHGDCTAINCTFTNNGVNGNKNEKDGGSMNRGTAIDCTFVNNHAGGCGGAIFNGTAVNCTFIYNSAQSGADVYNTECDENCLFLDSAYLTASDLITTYNSGEKLLFNFSAMVDDEEISFNNVNVEIKISQNGEEIGTYRAYSGEERGWIVTLEPGTYNATLSVGPAEPANVTITVNKIDAEISTSAEDISLFVGDESAVEYALNPSDADGDIIFTSSNPEVVSVDSTGAIKALSEGTVTITISLSSDHYNAPDATVNVEISRKTPELTATSVTTTYNVNKDLVITLKDEKGEALSGEEVTVDLNGTKTYTTDENGQVKIATGSLVPNTYNVKISFAGNDYYLGSDATAKVTVKKATPKITASAKTFTFEDKTKKYTVTLKDNNGNALKNTKVTLKVNGKTYTATTNSKGVATFKLSDITKGKKLTKKATYNAVISFAGDKYYNKVTKNVKLSVKAYAWKTVAKGSKDKAMVKKIQRALKKNHFYISFKGRYLKIDGIYHKYTVMAVKEFQRAKKLKVTGKVDEATAKKLKVY